MTIQTSSTGHKKEKDSSPIILDRIPHIKRSDEAIHYLVPEQHCWVCLCPIKGEFVESTGKCWPCYKKGLKDFFHFQALFAATLYVPDNDGWPHSSEILAMKNSGKFAKEYSEVLYDLIREQYQMKGVRATIVPIPQKEEGRRNYAPLSMARFLQDITGFPLNEDLLFTRVVDTQKGGTFEERYANMKDSMEYRGDPNSTHVYLVDDVFTTGATMSEASRAVHAAGVKTVISLVAGRSCDSTELRFVGLIEDDR